MANPLRWFRRHAKILMVVLGSGAMAIFGLGPVFDAMSRPPRSNDLQAKVIAEWKGGEITRLDLDSMRVRHYQTQRFLAELQRQAIAQKGDEFRPSVQPIPPIREGERFQENLVDEQLIERFLLAERAKEEGIIVSESIVDDYIVMASDDAELSRNDLVQINQEANQGGCSLESVKRHMELELLAMQMRLYTFTGQQGITNPSESIQLYRRVSERIACQTLPVAVDQYVAKISETPSESELKEIYEKGKFDYEDPTGERPGFKIRNKVKLQYFIAEYETFLQNAMNKITDEEVQKEYDRLVEEKDNMVMEPVPDEPGDTLQIDDPPPTLPGESGDMEKSETPDDVQPPPGDDGEEPQGDENKSEDEDKSEKKPEEPGDGGATGNSEPKKDGDQSSNFASSEYQLVSLTQDPAEKSEAPENQGQGNEKPEEQNQEDSDKEEKAAQDSSEDSSGGDEQAQSTASEGDVADVTPQTETEEIEKRVRPLKDVAEDIKRQLAAPDARKAMEEAVKKANAFVTTFHNLRMKWEYTDESKRGDEPAFAGVDQIAKECNLIVKETGLVMDTEFVTDPLGQIAVPRPVMMPDGTRQMRFTSVAERVFTMFDNIKLYDPMTANDFMTSNNYVYWLVEKEDTKVPEFEACRPAVEKFWKNQKALEMAKQEAQKIADNVNSQGKLMTELYNERATETGEFSWFNSFRGATIGNPVGVETPGSEFMDTAFGLEKMKAGIAANQTNETVYVVQLVSDRSSLDEIGNDYIENQFFKFKQIPPDVRGVSNWYRQELALDWNREFIDAMGLKFMGR